MTRFQIRRCRAHSSSVCWIVRQWQKGTESYVFYTSREEFEEAVAACR